MYLSAAVLTMHIALCSDEEFDGETVCLVCVTAEWTGIVNTSVKESGRDFLPIKVSHDVNSEGTV